MVATIVAALVLIVGRSLIGTWSMLGNKAERCYGPGNHGHPA